MDNKLKAISNNVNNNDTIVDLIKETDDRFKAIEASSDHVCNKNVPVLFTTIRGVHLRKSNKSSSNSYSISFCDLERWVSAPTDGGNSWKLNYFRFRTFAITSSRLDWRRLAHPTVQPLNQLKLCNRKTEAQKERVTSTVESARRMAEDGGMEENHRDDVT